MSEKEPSDFFIESAITGATPQLPWPIGGQPDPNDFKDLKELAQDLWVTLSTDQHQYFQDLVFEGFDQFWFEYKKLMYHNKPAKASNPKKDDKAPKKKAGRKKTQLHYLAPLPTDMTRVSPFFPGGHNCKKAGIRFDEPIIIKNSWGIATYQGPQLTMAHEDLLLAILAALCKTNRRVLDIRQYISSKADRMYVFERSSLNFIPAVRKCPRSPKFMLSQTSENPL